MATEAELAAMRQRFSEILLSPTCGRIRFRIGSLYIREGGYSVIGLSLALNGPAGGHGQQRRMSVRVQAMPNGVGAQYVARTNSIVVPTAQFGQNLDQRQAIVHEATHAVYDYFRLSANRALEEAGAYIAGAMYEQMERGFAPNPHPTGTIFHIAYDIAGSLATPHRLMMPWSDTVPPDQAQRLVNAVLASPTYHFILQQPTISYRHDGGRI